MDASQVKLLLTRKLSTFASIAILATAACAPQAATPTTAPPKPAPTTAPAKPAPTTAPAKPAPTTAPAKVEAPTAKPAATAAPAAKPTEKPAAKPAPYDEKAVADFYRGKTIRLVVGYGAGGVTDMSMRLLQKVYSKYIPGNPTVVVENRPGAGSMLAANTVYTTEPKDGTVIGAFSADLALQQVLGAPGVQFDFAKYQWLGSTEDTVSACFVRTDAGINSLQDIIGPNGKELAVASYGKGTASYNPPAVMNAVLGTKFKIVTGYDGGAAQILAVQNKEVQGYCTTFSSAPQQYRGMFEGANPLTKTLVILGDKPQDHPFAKGATMAETLTRTDEARAMLRAVDLPQRIQQPQAVVPEVPRDRAEALRRAREKAFADPEFIAAAAQAKREMTPLNGEEVTQLIQQLLNTPPATLAKLKVILE